MWSERWGPEHLLRRGRGGAKVVSTVQKLHDSEILRMKSFGDLRSLRAFVWICSSVPGAAR